MKPYSKRTQTLLETLLHSGNVEEEFEKIIEECESSSIKYKDPNFYPQKKIIEEYSEKLNGLEWKRLESQYPNDLYANISMQSVIQGSLGDCYFITSLMYATQHPELIKALFHPKSSLKYGVVLVYFCFLGEKIPVIVDTCVAYSSKDPSTPIFSHPRNNTESCWFALVEKAYAKACGGYYFIQGGKSSSGMNLLFDYFPVVYSPIRNIIPIHSLEEAETEISDENERIFSALGDLIISKAMIGTGTAEEYSSEFSESSGLVKDHSYIILDLKEKGDQKYIKLRNPWGTTEYKGAFREEEENEDEGYFWMPFEEYLNYFVDLNYSLPKEDWKEMSVFGKIDSYLDGRSPCAESPNIGCIPQWSIKFTKRTRVRLSYQISGPVSMNSIYICENRGQKVYRLNVKTKIKRSCSRSDENGIEYEVENFKEPLTFFFTREEAKSEPCYFRILIQSPDVDFTVSKFDDDFIKEKWNCATEKGYFNQNDQWNPFHKENPLSTCKQYFVYFPDLKYDEETELRFRVFKNITKGSFNLFFARTDKRIDYSLSSIPSNNFEIFSKSNYEEIPILINRKNLSLNDNNDSFHYVFAFYRNELNDVNHFKFSILSKSRFKFGALNEPNLIKNCIYQLKVKLFHDKNDGIKPNNNSIDNLKKWRLTFKELPTTLFIEYSSSSTPSNHYIYLFKQKGKDGENDNSIYHSFCINKDCLHCLDEVEIEDNSKSFLFCVTRDSKEDSSEFTVNIYGSDDFEMSEIDGKKLDRCYFHQEKKADFDYHEISFIEQPLNFSPKKCNLKLKVGNILNMNSLDSASDFILKAIIEQIKASNSQKKKLKDIENYHIFDLKIVFPNGKTQIIKNYNKMNFYEIFDSFLKEGFYYSESCIKNNFYLIPSENKFTGDFFEELEFNELDGKAVKINYDQMNFYFSENELASDAYNALRKIYKDSESISIFNEANQKLKYLYFLKSNEKYSVKIEYRVIFKMINGNFSTQYIDYLTTFSDAIKIITSLYNTESEQCNPEYIIMYDQDQKMIKNHNQILKDVQSLDKVFYFEIDKYYKIIEAQKEEFENQIQESMNKSENEVKFSDSFIYKTPKKEKKISKRHKEKKPELEAPVKKPEVQPIPTIKIIFICEDQYEEQFNPIEFTLPTNITIGKIQELISYEFIIPQNQLVIKYLDEITKTKIEIDPKKTIEDVRDKIKEKEINGRYRNYLFFEFIDTFSYFNYNQTRQNQYKIFYKTQPTKKFNSVKISNDLPKVIKTKTENSKVKIRLAKREYPEKTLKPPKKERPQQTTIINEELIVPEKVETNSLFHFEYEEKERELSFPNDLLLLETENVVKQIFKINQREEIEFFYVKENGREEYIEKLSASMDTLKNKKIKIYLHRLMKKPKRKYYYKINNGRVVFGVKLEFDSTIKRMKKKIAKLYNINNLSRIRIFLNRKELSDEVTLEFLDADKKILSVNIEDEEIFLITETIQNTTEPPIEAPIEEEEEDI